MAIVHASPGPRSLPERILYGVLLLAVLALGFFFLVAALIAGAIVAGGILLRLWWIRRGRARAEKAEFITTEYSVIEREPRDPAQPTVPAGRLGQPPDE